MSDMKVAATSSEDESLMIKAGSNVEMSIVRWQSWYYSNWLCGLLSVSSDTCKCNVCLPLSCWKSQSLFWELKQDLICRSNQAQSEHPKLLIDPKCDPKASASSPQQGRASCIARAHSSVETRYGTVKEVGIAQEGAKPWRRSLSPLWKEVGFKPAVPVHSSPLWPDGSEQFLSCANSAMFGE